jgi:hypothetical protein
VESLAREALTLFRDKGELYQPPRLVRMLGYLAEARGELSTALVAYQECLAANRELNDRRGMAAALVGMAGIALRLDAYAAATQLLAGIEAMMQQEQFALLPGDQSVFEQLRLRCRTHLSPEEADAAAATGALLDLDKMLALAAQVTSGLVR